MSPRTEVTISHTSVAATVSAGGVEVALGDGAVTAAVVGVPGPRGEAGEKGETGAPGAGLPAGGGAGQLAVKRSAGDLDVGWTSTLVVDPETGWVGAGTDAPKAPLHARGPGQALIVESALAPGQRWTISPGHPGGYEESLIFAFDDTVIDTRKHALRLQLGQPLTLPFGAVAADGASFASLSSAALAFYEPFNGTSGRLAFRGSQSSGESALQFVGTYHDGSYHSANVMKLSYSASGGSRVTIGDLAPTAALHVDGAIRTEPRTTATVPDPAAAGAGTMIYVSDAGGGARPFWSDGTEWRDAGGTVLS